MHAYIPIHTFIHTYTHTHARLTTHTLPFFWQCTNSYCPACIKFLARTHFCMNHTILRSCSHIQLHSTRSFFSLSFFSVFLSLLSLLLSLSFSLLSLSLFPLYVSVLSVCFCLSISLRLYLRFRQVILCSWCICVCLRVSESVCVYLHNRAYHCWYVCRWWCLLFSLLSLGVSFIFCISLITSCLPPSLPCLLPPICLQ